MIVIALWIRAVSPGPIFFRQERVGYLGRRFMMLKFRSMQADAEMKIHEAHFDSLVESNRPMTKLDTVGDSRLIQGGRILRAAGLDELPQILNVIRGEMSLVGPRPCTFRELQKFQGPYEERFNAPPGLTGHWQVHGKNNTTFSEMVDLDIYYTRNMSLKLDLAIVARTFPVLAQLIRETQARSSAAKAATNFTPRMAAASGLDSHGGRSEWDISNADLD
jgi:lipopolysaccharide/colanic/teichoic acid biosynthesis glycosyltransferase